MGSGRIIVTQVVVHGKQLAPLFDVDIITLLNSLRCCSPPCFPYHPCYNFAVNTIYKRHLVCC